MALRYGILCNSTTFNAWEAQCLELLDQIEGVELVLLVVNDEHKVQSSPRGMHRKAWSLISDSAMSWTLYRRYFVNKGSKAMKNVDLSNKMKDVPSILCQPIKKGKFSEYLSEDDLAKIREYAPDFLLRFGFGIIRGEILELPRYGVWSYHHDDLDKYRGRPPCFWEIYNDDPVSGAVLQRLTDKLDGGIVLKRGYFKTMKTSYKINREKVYLGSVEWPAQVCRDILNGSGAYVDAPPSSTKAPIYYRPKRIELLKFVFKTTRNYLGALLGPLYQTDKWNVGVVDKAVHEFLEETELPEASWAPAGKHTTFIADPYAIDEKTVIAEEFDFKTNKGHITVFESENHTLSRMDIAINGGSHLSYPFIHRENGRYFCLPEASESGELVLYESTGFPLKWEKVATLLKEPILDPTLLRHDDYWWLFGTLNGYYPDTKLFLWYAEDIRGPWKQHPSAPVKCDIRSSRPAGSFFHHNGELYRPAQDCRETYGGGIAINRVLSLTMHEFREETVTWIQPSSDSPYPHGTHTLVQWGNRTLVDGKRRVFMPSASMKYIEKKLSRIPK